jgi:hypothetical protein
VDNGGVSGVIVMDYIYPMAGSSGTEAASSGSIIRHHSVLCLGFCHVASAILCGRRRHHN